MNPQVTGSTAIVELKMKNAIVTGSEGQLGKCFVSKLQTLGYQVIGFDLAEQANSSIDYCHVDVTSRAEIKSALDKINGNIDVLINNAGTFVFSPFEDRTDDELDSVIGVNLKGTILMTQAIFNRYFVHQGKGCIVNIGSIYGVIAGDMRLYNQGDRRTSEVYGATKAAVINLTKYFSAYMASHNVRVNCISPGGIFNHQDKEFVSKYSSKVPLERMGNDDELSSTLEYLISDESSYVTGQNIIVDGGFTVL